jgi:LysR family nitrogen assimilation transcriptional regulator
MLESLVNGRLDIAVLYNAQASPEIETLPLQDEDLLLVQRRPPGLQEDPGPGPIALKDVAKLPLVIPSRPNAIRMQVESEMANIGCRPLIALEIDGVSAILDLVRMAPGVPCCRATRWPTPYAPRPSRCGRLTGRRCEPGCRWRPVHFARPR